ncbi:MAG TPA: hypothetical protein VFE51_20805 [Verrucomicrobiae bacterium]|nr:hypothetical protein [Verrucomicrobiae bacterium]
MDKPNTRTFWFESKYVMVIAALIGVFVTLAMHIAAIVCQGGGETFGWFLAIMSSLTIVPAAITVKLLGLPLWMDPDNLSVAALFFAIVVNAILFSAVGAAYLGLRNWVRRRIVL